MKHASPRRREARFAQTPGPPARRPAVESLEPRTLLSVSVATLVGPINLTGTHWEYAGVDGQGNTNTLIETAAGPTTFNGNACCQVDVGPTAASHLYEGFDGAGNLLEYGGFIHYPSGEMQTDVDTPAQSIPAQLEAGTTYTSTYTDNETDVDSTGTTTSSETDTGTTTLVGDTTSPITVPAGTYDAYEVKSSDTRVTPNGDGTNTTTTATTTTDEWVAAGVGLVKAIDYDQDGSVSATFSLSVFKYIQSKLAFRQPPLDAAVGDTIKPPVTVEIDDAAGNVQTGASGSITLILGGGSAGAKLGGTLTEPVSGGIATFSDLSVDTAGTGYTLTAADSGSTPAQPASSQAFNVTDAKLVFVNGPHKADTGVPLNPGVTVELEDAKGNPITTSDGTVITLNTVGYTGGAAVAGNTATLSNGVAVFKGLTFKTAGTYILDATDPAGDTEATSGKFTIGGGKLVFTRVPKTADAGATFKPPVVVTVVDSKGRVVTTNSDSIQVEYGDPSGGGVSGTFTANAVGGKGTFRTVSISKAGTYNVLALDATTLAATGDLDAVTHAQGSVKVLGEHLAFINLPKTVGLAATTNIRVAVENARNQIEADATAVIELSNLVELSGGNKGSFDYPTAIQTRSGVATLPLKLSEPGTYTIDAGAIDTSQPIGSDGQYPGVPSIDGATSEPFVVEPLRTLFIHPGPKSTTVGSPVTFRVAVVNKGGVISTATDGYIDVGLASASASTGFALPNAIVPLVWGIATVMITLPVAGTFTLAAGVVPSPTDLTPFDGITSGVSKPFSVR